MAATLPNPDDCNCDCATTCEPAQVPGPQGAAGVDGVDGTDGKNAFSLVAAQFAVPAQQAAVLVTLTEPPGNAWMMVGQVVAVEGAGIGTGYYGVQSLAGTNQATLLNLRDDATGVYTGNLDGVGNIAAGLSISPGGVQGPAGIVPAGAFLVANNLSEGVAATMRTNLGLGTAALGTTGVANTNIPAINDAGGLTNGEAVFATATGIESKTAASARTALGAAASGLATASGLTASATDKVLGRSSAGAGAIEEIACTAAARAVLDDASAAAMRETLGKVGVRYGLLGNASAVDANANADTALVMVGGRYRIDKLTVESASISLTVATAGLFTAAGGLGTALALDQALAALTAAAKFDDLTLEAIVGTDVRTEGTLYFRIGTPQGAAATLNAWIWGWRFD